VNRFPTLPNVHPTSPYAAYIHIPFCIYRCGYCNFTVVTGRKRDNDDAYLLAIGQEMEMLLQNPRPVRTVYIGGGTPTELSPQRLQTLGQLIDQWLPREPEHESTVEANPENMTNDRVEALLKMRVNRISLGIQSFQPRKLKALERIHRPDELLQALRLAQSSFDQVSIDLMFAAPGETLKEWEEDLDRAIQAGPGHISTYGLTYEPETRFFDHRKSGKFWSSPTRSTPRCTCWRWSV